MTRGGQCKCFAHLSGARIGHPFSCRVKQPQSWATRQGWLYTRRVRTIFKLVMVLVVGGAVFYGVVVALNPWALHIGGQPTPLLYWTGMGTLTAKDGKTYPLYVFFYPGGPASHLRLDGLRPNSGLRGTAELCSAPGTTELLKLSGTMYGGYRSTEGSLMGFRLLEWRKSFQINPQYRGFFDLAGRWRGAELVMDRPGEQGIAFQSGMFIDHATVTLHAASRGEFEAACRAMGSAAGR